MVALHPGTVPEAHFLGLKLYEWLTLIGIVLGPIFAVGITLVIEKQRRVYERRLSVLRTMLNTRKLGGDPGWISAINMIPVDFNKHSKVVSAYRSYFEHVRHAPTPETRVTHEDQTTSKQTVLIYEIAKTIGVKLTQEEIRTGFYISQGFIDRDNLNIDAFKAARDIATTLQRQSEATIGYMEAAARLADAQRQDLEKGDSNRAH